MPLPVHGELVEPRLGRWRSALSSIKVTGPLGPRETNLSSCNVLGATVNPNPRNNHTLLSYMLLAPSPPASCFTTGFGRKGARCSFTPIGPLPGPPPPCGWLNVLCRL